MEITAVEVPRKVHSFKDGDTIFVNGIEYEFFNDSLCRIERDPDGKKIVDSNSPAPSIVCPYCFNSKFDISYKSYECIGNCSCGHRIVLYEG